jgi:UDPglucose 6-dehydrogenase
MGSNLAGKKIAVWGLAFKPNTDDMREAPALTVIPELVKAGAKVVAFDPVAMEHARELLGSGVEFADSSMAAIQGADALVLITEWNEFRHVDFDQIASQMKGRWIFDGRNIWNPKAVRQKGFQYSGMGRP